MGEVIGQRQRDKVLVIQIQGREVQGMQGVAVHQRLPGVTPPGILYALEGSPPVWYRHCPVDQVTAQFLQPVFQPVQFDCRRQAAIAPALDSRLNVQIGRARKQPPIAHRHRRVQELPRVTPGRFAAA
ncbi:hypothetical protein D3C72_1884860 [compost metagenome]